MGSEVARARTLLVLIACTALSAGCAAPARSPQAPVQTAEDGAVLLFSSIQVDEPVTNFLITGAVPIPGGRAAVSYDVAYPEAGDGGIMGEPRIAVLESDGSLTAVVLPELGGRPVGPGVIPLASSSAGDVYIWDPNNNRIVRWPQAGDWTTVLDLDPATLFGAPRASAGPNDELYVATADTVLRVTSGGDVERVAGVEPNPAVPGAFPEATRGSLPRPATAGPLPYISGLVADTSGSVYVGIESAILMIARGQLTLVADSTANGSDGQPLIREPSVDEQGGRTGSILTSLALASDGSLLAGDSGLQRILRFAPEAASVLVDPASSVSNGSNLTSYSEPTLLFLRDGGQMLFSISA